MTFTVTLDDSAVRAGLDRMPQVMVQSLANQAERLALKLEAHVQRDKLQGQVLNPRSGKLSRSIHHDGSDSGTAVTRRVYSAGVPYAGVHEFGFDGVEEVRAHLRSVVFGRQVEPFTVGPFSRHMKLPERSFLRSSLKDMREEIVTGLGEAGRAGARQAIGQR